MSTYLPPIDPKNNSFPSSGTEETKTPVEQEISNEVEQYVNNSCSQLTLDQRKAFSNRIRELTSMIFEEIAKLKGSGTSADVVRRIAGESLVQLRESGDAFLKKNVIYTQKKNETKDTFKKIDDKIQKTTFNNEDFVLPQEYATANDDDFLYAYKKSRVEENRVISQGVSTVVNLLIAEPVKFLGEVIDYGVKKDCKKTPTSQKVCQTVSDLTKTVLEKSGISSVYNKAHEVLSDGPIALKHELERQYQIASDERSRDTKTILTKNAKPDPKASQTPTSTQNKEKKEPSSSSVLYYKKQIVAAFSKPTSTATSNHSAVSRKQKEEQPAKKRKSFMEADAEARMWNHTMETMSNTALVADTFRGMTYVIVESAKEGYKQINRHPAVFAAKLVYQISPLAQNIGNTIGNTISNIATETPKRLKQEVGQAYKQLAPQYLKNTVSYLGAKKKQWKQNHKNYVEWRVAFNQEFGIAPELTRKYDKDASEAVKGTALFLATGALLNASIRSMKFAGILFKGPKIFTPSVPKEPLPAIYKPSDMHVPSTKLKKRITFTDMEKIDGTWVLKSFFNKDAGSVKNPFMSSPKTPGIDLVQVKPNFVLIEPKKLPLKNVGKVSNSFHQNIKVLNKWKEGDSVNKLIRFEGERFDFTIGKGSHKTHVANISFMNDRTTWYHTETLPTGLVKIISSKSVKEPAAVPSKMKEKMLNMIKHFSEFEGSKRVIVEIGSKDKEIFKWFYERYTYLGRKSLTSFGTHDPLNVHMFEILLKNRYKFSQKEIANTPLFKSSKPSKKRKTIACSDGLDPEVMKAEYSFKQKYLFLNKWNSMYPDDFALKVTNQTIQIQDPQSFQIVTDKFQHLIKNSAERTQEKQLGGLICDLQREIEHLIPDFTHLGQTPEALWNAIIRKKVNDSTGKVKVKYLTKDSHIAEITAGKHVFIIKERGSEDVINEWIGLTFLRTQQLQNLETAELVAVCKYRPKKFQERFFIIKTFVPGETLESMMMEMGEQAFNSPKRITLKNEMIQASHQTGKALGELQNKGLKYQMKASAEQTDQVIKGLEAVIEETYTELLGTGIRRIKSDSARVRNLCNAFKNDPGELSFGLRDIHNEQFVYSKKSSTLGFIDLESIPDVLDISQKPLALVADEYYAFLHTHESSGMLHKLSVEEIHEFKEAFKRGYFSEYSGLHTQAATQFFEFYNTIDRMHAIAVNSSLKQSEKIEALKKLKSKINKILDKVSNPITNLVKND